MRHRRPGFTFAEVLMASTIFLMVMGFALGLFTSSFRLFKKGDDSQSSVQEASLIISRLRHDLMMITGKAGVPDLIYNGTIAGDGRSLGIEMAYEPFRLITSAAPAPGPDVDAPPAAGRQLTFHGRVAQDREIHRVTWRYDQDGSSMERLINGEVARRYAVPRIREFSFAMRARPDPSAGQPQSGDDLVEVFDLATGTTVDILRLWFAVSFQVKGDQAEVRMETTTINLESGIFPKAVNRRAPSLWESGT